MPQGDKSSYTAKQKRKAAHIEAGYKKKGVSTREAEERAWRTVNKQDGGAKKKKASGKTSSRGRKSTARKSGGSRKRTSGKSPSRARSSTSTRSTSRSRR